jgi:hypothetical protein
MGEVERLRRDREALARELSRLQREQQEARAAVLDMERSVRGTERRQEQCAAFLSRAVASPALLDGLLARRRRSGGQQEATAARHRHAERGGPRVRGDGPGGGRRDRPCRPGRDGIPKRGRYCYRHGQGMVRAARGGADGDRRRGGGAAHRHHGCRAMGGDGRRGGSGAGAAD